jgi:hypothetical protein
VTPAFDSGSCARQTKKPVGIETFVTKSAIERFDVAILHRPAWFDVPQQHSMLFAPSAQGTRDELRSVVDVDLFRKSSCECELLENADHTQSWQTGIGFGGQTLARVFIDDCKDAKRSTERQGVAEEIHGPSLIPFS